MADEREGNLPPEDLPRSFNRASVWRRIAIVAAGPIANLLLAVLLYTGLYVAGVPGHKPVLAEPPAGTPAAVAGFAAGDRVTGVDGVAVESFHDLRWRLLDASGRDRIELAVATLGGAQATRVLSLAQLSGSDWEGPFIAEAGLAADFGPPLIEEASPGSRRRERASAPATGSSPSMARRCASPADVALATNAKPGVEILFRVERDGARFDVPLVPDVTESGGRRWASQA